MDQMVGEGQGGAFETDEVQMEVNDLALTVRLGGERIYRGDGMLAELVT